MAQGTIKLTQLSQDLNLKSKDLIDSLKSFNIDKKTGASLDADEFEHFINRLTLGNQLKNIDDYLDGKTSIKIKGKANLAPKAEPKVEPAPAPKAEPKAEPAPAPKAEPKAEPAPAPKAEPKAEPAPAPKAEPRVEAKPIQKAEPKPEINKTQKPNDRPQQRPEVKTQYQQKNNQYKDKGNDRAQYQRYNERPQENPFAKKQERMQREAQGFRGQNANGIRPNQNNAQRPNNQQNVNKGAQIPAQAPVQQPTVNTVRPAQQAALEKQKAQAEKAKQLQNQPKEVRKKEEKKAQKQQFQKITPTLRENVQGGVNIGVTYTAETQKTRVVDTRTSDVNLSKYDDHYNDQYYNIARGIDNQSQKQKLKKQDNRGQNQKSAKDKERAAQERLKKLEAEKARQKQLEFTVPDEITVVEFASRLKKTAGEVIKKLMFMGEMKGLNDVIDYATAELIADEFGAKVTKEVVVTIEEKLFTEADDNEDDLIERAPVVCVMGHVDHGKTSILDAIRHTNVTKGEAGGITQAIGAYCVKANGKDITFLDTPGHEAFTAMRMRGAKSTDIAILVVAADDGVMPQTVEAISHAKAAGIDIVVAINKMDKPTANPDNVLNQLTQYELVPEAWGGDVICVPVSAHTGMGIGDLLESVLLVAEVKELKANPQKRARGLVIESKLDRGRGPVATVLVQNGTLHQGDYVIVGNAVGRVRAMIDDKGKTTKVAGPSVPVEIVGLDDVPQAGDELNAVEDERMAKNLASQRREKLRQEILAANARMNLDDLFSQIAEGVKTLNIIVKADVAGSAEAVKASLLKLSNEEVKVSVIHSAVGGITESDVMLAAASNAIIVGFSVRPDKNALDSAERNGVDIRTHRIIYDIINEIEAAMKGMLAPTFKEVLLGHAEVRQTIHVPNVGTIAGSYILDGKITRQSQIRVVRDGIVIFEDKISSLRRFKDDVKEVNDGYECGIGLDKFNDIKVGDVLEAFVMEEVERK